MLVKLLVDAGDMKPNPAISQKLGPLGLNLGKLVQDVNKATIEFKGIKVPVTLNIDTKTKNVNVEVSTPPVSELLKKELKIEKGSGEPNNIKVANAALEQVVAITKTKMPSMLATDFKEALKSVLGTCVSLGILVESKDPREVTQQLDAEYKEIVNKQIVEVSAEKKSKLDEYFTKVKTKQDEVAKRKAEEEAAKEAEKAAAATAAPAAGTAAPAAGTEKKAEPAKAEKKEEAKKK